MVGDEFPVTLDDRMTEVLDDAKRGATAPVRCFRIRVFADRAECIANLADVGRAKLEAERGVDANRVQKAATDEFDPRDVRLGRLMYS